MKKNLFFSGILGLGLVLVAGLILAGCGNHSEESGVIELKNSSSFTITNVSIEDLHKNKIRSDDNHLGPNETRPYSVPVDSYRITVTLDVGSPFTSPPFKLPANETVKVSYEGTVFSIE